MKKLFTFKNFLILCFLEILFITVMTLTNEGWTGLGTSMILVLLQCFIFVAFAAVRGIIDFIKKPRKSKIFYIKFFFGLTLLNTLLYLLAVFTIKKVEFNLITLLVEKPLTSLFTTLVFLCFKVDLSAFKSKNEEEN